MSQPDRQPSRPQKSRGRPLRNVVIAAVVIAGAVAAWYWYQSRDSATESAYRTTEIERGNIRVAISSTGTLSAISTVTVGSQISGQVMQVLADFNSEVESGQVLAIIDPSTYQTQIEQGNAQIASARASLAQAQATLQNAEIDHRRKAELGARQLVAQSDVDLARSALDQARAAVNSAQASILQQTASLQTTQVNLDRTVIRSPVTGVVLTRSIEPGQTVAASLQAPELFTIAEDLRQMKIELAVDEADIGQVQPGQSVSFSVDAFPDRQFRGVVDQVRLAATTVNNVVTYPVVVSVDNSDGTLLPGLTVNAEIEISRRDDVLKVSSAALRYRPVAGAGAQAPSAPAAGARAGGAGGGLDADLSALVDELDATSAQRAAFDAALQARRERQEAGRQAARSGGTGTQPGPGGPPGMMVFSGGAPDANMQAQMRQRMLERSREDFAAFRELLDAGQQQQWDRNLQALLTAQRVTLYRLVDGQPQPVMVRVGASDGSSTEISGPVEAGDLIVTGERAVR